MDLQQSQSDNPEKLSTTDMPQELYFTQLFHHDIIDFSSYEKSEIINSEKNQAQNIVNLKNLYQHEKKSDNSNDNNSINEHALDGIVSHINNESYNPYATDDNTCLDGSFDIAFLFKDDIEGYQKNKETVDYINYIHDKEIVEFWNKAFIILKWPFLITSLGIASWLNTPDSIPAMLVDFLLMGLVGTSGAFFASLGLGNLVEFFSPQKRKQKQDKKEALANMQMFSQKIKHFAFDTQKVKILDTFIQQYLYDSYHYYKQETSLTNVENMEQFRRSIYYLSTNLDEQVEYSDNLEKLKNKTRKEQIRWLKKHPRDTEAYIKRLIHSMYIINNLNAQLLKSCPKSHTEQRTDNE
jgi:hypothetical protein